MSRRIIKYKTLYEEYKEYCKEMDIKHGSFSDFKLYIQYVEEECKNFPKAIDLEG